MRIINRNTLKQRPSEIVSPHDSIPAQGPRVITITSGKGGVGKTNLAVNLSIALAGEGQRVILFDADLGMANVEVLLGMTPALTLYDHLFKNIPISDILLPGPGGIKIISGGAGFLELANLSTKQRTKLLNGIEILNSMADFVMIDTGAGISKDVLAFCAAADEMQMVITPEPTSLTDAYSLIKVMDRFKLHKEVGLVINQARSNVESSEPVHRLINLADRYLTIRLKHLGSIPWDQSVVRAVKNQTPFYLAKPQSSASAAVKRIATVMLNKSKPVDAEGGLRGFISKLTRLFK
ncbi:MinD/ParA family protein [Desulfallas thermosapovorans]|uniref:Flagellar biosynthesis protein FlhG n=1 Tax=Desulfallas thermosapovorans DSM 6562 TaxID=1121431 RepID=A0A5S4ZTV1_9FIRM|nr:MinD/ParA family protein [Desulfallas thermosapovorans]TYO96293.1 flagellar biosynthesis protein FlhG [Desulfallas thermosapovorans DSM 6562]